MKPSARFLFPPTPTIIAAASLLFLLIFPGMSSASEEREIHGIPCGSWMAYLTLTEKCELLEEYFGKWEPLAEQGNPLAQTMIGLKFLQFPQTREKAATWMHKAAVQGFAPAQFELALLYESGSGGVARDEVKAAMWYGLAAERGESKAKEKLNDLEKKLSLEARDQARKRVKEWQPTPFEQSAIQP